MKMMHQQPLRTYQRKKTKQVATGQYQSTRNLTSLNAASSNKKSKLHQSKEIDATIKFSPDDDSFNYDPFNTTFDRLLKNNVATNLQTGNLNNNASSDSSYNGNNQIYKPPVDVQRFSGYTKKQANSGKTKNNKQEVKYVKKTLSKEQNKSNSKIQQFKSKLSRKVKKAPNKIKNVNMSRDKELQQKDAVIIPKLTSNTVSVNENVLVINSDISGSADILNCLNNTNIHSKEQEILSTSFSKKSIPRRDSDKDSQSFSNGIYMCNKNSSDNCNTSVTDMFEVHQTDLESHETTTKITNALLINVSVDKITKRQRSNMSCDMSFLEIMAMENHAKLLNIKPCFVNLSKITMSPCKTKNNNRSMLEEVIDVTDTCTNLSSTNVQCYNLPFATGQNNIITGILPEKYDSRIKENLRQNFIDKITHCCVEVTPLKIESSKASKTIVSSTPLRIPVKNSRLSTSLSPINLTDLDKESTMNDNSQTDLNNMPSSIKRLSNIQINKSDQTPISTAILNVCSTSQTADCAIPNKDTNIALNYNCLPITEQGTERNQNIEMHITSPQLLSISEKSDRTFSLFMSSNDEIYSTYGNETKENVSYNNSVEIFSHTGRSDVDDLFPKKMNEILEIPYNLKRNILAIQNTVNAVSTEEQKGSTKINDELSSGHTECTVSQRYLEDNKKCDGAELHVTLTRLQNPARITKRKQYKNWGLQLTNIDESCNGSTNYYEKRRLSKQKSNNVDKLHTKKVKILEHKSPLSENGCTESESLSTTAASMQSEGILYLRPGKSWARSLSILNNIQRGSNIDELATGKGRKWRHSVKHILDMQAQHSSGVLQSCIRSNLKVQSHVPDESTHDHLVQLSKQNALRSSNSAHFSRRVSVRIVPDIKNIKASNNISLLEAYLITESEKNFKHDESYANTEINRNEDDPVIQAKDVVLQRCSQTDYLSFTECYPNEYLEHWYKIGEGVYGEVFFCDFEEQESVIKIIPIEGIQLVNGEPQKKFSEILSEILIAKELHNLRFNETYATNGFVEVKSIKCIIGKYPEKLIELWNIYDEEKSSDNDCPAMFDECQLYITLELGHGGQDLEAFVFHSAEEAHASFIQAALALAVAEKSLEFEHRDLHWGNILLSRTDEPFTYYKLDNKNIQLPSKGIKVSIIDFTLSRISHQGCCIFNDLGLDPALFTAQGEYQFEVYRLMRDKINNTWHEFEPFTNILWLHYTLDKMITAVRYKRKTLKIHKINISKLEKLKNIILNYDSAYDFVVQCDEVRNSYMLSQHTFVPLQHTNEILETSNNRVCVQ